MKKIPTIERVKNMSIGVRNLALSAHDLRWQCLGEGDHDALESIEFLCNNLEECVSKLTLLHNELTVKQGTKKKTLVDFITG